MYVFKPVSEDGALEAAKHHADCVARRFGKPVYVIAHKQPTVDFPIDWSHLFYCWTKVKDGDDVRYTAVAA